MFCKKCGKELENDVVYCPSCGEMNSAEITCLPERKVNVKKNLIENAYKIALAVVSIAVFFLPWINLAGMSINFFEANKIISTVKKLMDGVLGIIGGDLESISEVMDLDVDTVMKILNIDWGDGSEIILLLQSSKWILYIIAAIILLNISYIIFLILGKEKKWMMVSLILLHIVFSTAMIMLRFAMPLEIIRLSFGPVVMIGVQGILGELAAQKEADLREKMS